MAIESLENPEKTSHYLLSVIFACILTIQAEHSGPVSPVTSGYGADSSIAVRVDSIPSESFRKKKILIYYPENSSEPMPVIFFLHGMSTSDRSVYEHLLNHIASRGYYVIMPVYKLASFPYQRRTYKKLFSSIVQAVNHCAQRIDSTRIGFIGHSFGAGAIPAFTWQCLMNRNWGKNGTFMFMMAPFYVFRIRQEQLEQFPGHVKLIMQVYEEDDCNDHRIAKDIFETINIDNTEKDFILMMSDSTEEYAFTADHGVPYGFGDENGEVDGLDFYGIYRLVDALAEYTFKKDQDAKEVALGNGNSRQRFMGEWPDARPVRELVISDTPEMVHHSKWYFFHWKHPWNPRRRKR